MNIGFDNQIFGLQTQGGISRYFNELGRALTNAGHGVFLPAGLHVNIHLRNAEFRYSGIYVKKYPKALANKIRRINDRYNYSYFQNQSIDLIHETYYAKKIYQKKPKPIVITIHDFIPEIFEDEYKTDAIVNQKREAIARADHIICVSKGTQHDLIERFAVPLLKTSIVYHGISTMPTPTKLLHSEVKRNETTKPYFLFVGNRQGYKNFSGMIRAFSKTHELTKNFKLIAFGGGKFTSQELALISELGLKTDVSSGNIFQKNGDDQVLSSLLNGALAMIYPSKYEGFGMPPLEAMAAGCPVISSNASVMPEVLGDAAYYFNPHCQESIIFALKAVASSNQLKLDLIRKGMQQATKYSWDRCGIETARIYRSLT